MNKTILEFADGTAVECTVIGQVIYEGDPYVVFVDRNDKTVYIYQKIKLKNGKLKVKQVRNKDTFEGVCGLLNELVDRDPDAGRREYGRD